MAFGQNQGYNSGTRMPAAGRISLMLIVRLGKKKNIFKTSLRFERRKMISMRWTEDGYGIDYETGARYIPVYCESSTNFSRLMHCYTAEECSRTQPLERKKNEKANLIQSLKVYLRLRI